MTGLKVLLDQPRDSFSAGTFVNMIPFGNDTVLPFIQVDCRGWDIFENRARNLREAAACESLFQARAELTVPIIHRAG